MPKQVVVIHGGRTFTTYRGYIHSLKHREVDIGKFKPQKDWRDSLQKQLGRNYEVFVPKMPNSNNSVYQEWKIWFERMAAFLHNDVILIGHSLGGIFLAKYLCENTFKKKIKAVILVAAPCEEKNLKEDLCDFCLPKSFKRFARQAKKIYLIFSKDDPVVPFKHAQEYKAALPNSELITFKRKQHFNQETFPELVKLIKNI